MTKNKITQELRKSEIKRPIPDKKCDEDKCPIVKKG